MHFFVIYIQKIPVDLLVSEQLWGMSGELYATDREEVTAPEAVEVYFDLKCKPSPTAFWSEPVTHRLGSTVGICCVGTQLLLQKSDLPWNILKSLLLNILKAYFKPFSYI